MAVPPEDSPARVRRRLRVLIAKLGLDGHDMGARYVARRLRDQGCEVIYTGLHATAEQVAETALQEGVDVVGVSILSGAHVELCRDLVAAMRRRDLGNIPVVAGGVILAPDIEALHAAGVAAVFPSTAPEENFIEYFRNLQPAEA